MQSFVKKYYPDTVVANKAINVFSYNVMSRFFKIFITLAKQQTLDRF